MSGVRSLSSTEQGAWRAYRLASHLLEDALDRQLQRDAGMPHTYYIALVELAEAPGGCLRMRRLAAMLRHSPSRITHAVARMEAAGWVRREVCPDDGRGQLAVLTESGRATLADATPGHVAEVRGRVFARLAPDQVRQLRGIAETLLGGLEPAAAPRRR